MKQETMTYLEQAIQDGLASISGEGKKQRIHYHAVDHTYLFFKRNFLV